MRTENWCGYNIRFVEIDGEWWAILKDICDALKLSTRDVSQRIPAQYMERVKVPMTARIPDTYKFDHERVKQLDKTMIGKDIGRRKDDVGSNDVVFNEYAKTYWMLAVNELGIYEAIFASRKLEARRFRMWAGTVMQKLRTNVGLAGYEVMCMTDTFSIPYPRFRIRSIQGGDVEQVPFE